MLFIGVLNLVGGSGVSLLGVSLKGLYVVCLLDFFFFVECGSEVAIYCKVQNNCLFSSYKSNSLLS